MPLVACIQNDCDKRTRNPDVRDGLCAHCYSHTEAGREEYRLKRNSSASAQKQTTAQRLGQIMDGINEIIAFLHSQEDNSTVVDEVSDGGQQLTS